MAEDPVPPARGRPQPQAGQPGPQGGDAQPAAPPAGYPPPQQPRPGVAGQPAPGPAPAASPYMVYNQPPGAYPPPAQPPQQGGTGVQPQGYPPQGYPAQGYPTQGYPTQGYPGQGYPAQAPPGAYPPAYGAAPAYAPAPYAPAPYAPAPYAPAPYGYPYAAPYAAPLPPAPPGQETQAALDRLKQGAWVAIAASSLTFMIGIIAVVMVAGNDTRPTWIHPAGFPLHIIAFFAQAIAVGVSWMGLDDLKDGAREIHPQHVERFKKAYNWLIAAGLIWLLGGVAGFLFGGFAFFSSLTSGNSVSAGVLSYQLTFGVVGLLMNILIALVLQQALADLMQARGRALVQMFYVMAIGGSIVSVGLSIAGVIWWGSPSVAPIASIMSVLAMAIWLRQLDSAKAGTQVITTRRTDPDGGAPPAAVAPA